MASAELSAMEWRSPGVPRLGIEPCRLERERRPIAERLRDLNLFIAELPAHRVSQDETSHQSTLHLERNREHGPEGGALHSLPASGGHDDARVGQEVGGHHRAPLLHREPAAPNPIEKTMGLPSVGP